MTITETLPCDPIALSILHRLREAGYEAYFVGGCVRDHLMGKQPKDWDIATSAVPDQIEVLFKHTVAVGKAFGVILVVEGGEEFEVATFRGDGAYSDARRPDRVTFTSAAEDVKRRDFTCNALMYDPTTNTIIDRVGGRQDIEQGLLRTVGDPAERFGEDHLRLLRAVRFAARTNFRIEDRTLQTIRQMAGLVSTVSAERIGGELTRMLAEGHACRSLEWLDATGLLVHVLPEIDRMHGVEQPPRFHPEGDVFVHTSMMLAGLDQTIARSLKLAEGLGKAADAAAPCFEDTAGMQRVFFPAAEHREVLAWAVLLHDVGKPDTISFSDRIRFNCHDARSAEIAEHVLTRMRRSKRTTTAVCELVGRHMKFCHITTMRQAKRRRLLQDPLFPLHLELHRLDCLSSHGKLDKYQYGYKGWHEEQARPPELEPLLTGHDLLAMGYAAGPAMGRILNALQDARLEGAVASAEQARAWVEEHFPQDR